MRNYGKKKRNKGKKKNFFPKQTAAPYGNLLNVNLANVPVPMDQFQYPHHGEVVDLTDDLAPEMSANSSKTTHIPQPVQNPLLPTPGVTVKTADNKLNFKFQKTIPKTPNWSMYQNTFKRLGAASPDTDPDDQEGGGENKSEVKIEPNKPIEALNLNTSQQLPILGEDVTNPVDSANAEGSTKLNVLKVSVRDNGNHANYCLPDNQTTVSVYAGLTEIQEKLLRDVLKDFESVFAFKTEQWGCYNGKHIAVRTTDEEPVYIPLYKQNARREKKIDTHIRQLLQYGIIEESESAYSSQAILIEKKKCAYHVGIFYVNFQALNNKILLDPVSKPNNMLDLYSSCLTDATFIAELDINRGYWQLPLGEGKEKTAFTTHLGLYHFKKLPFGLQNSQVEYLRVMEELFVDIKHKNVLFYTDTIIVFGKTFEEFVLALAEVLTRLKKANLAIIPSKSKIGYPDITVLGHKFSRSEVQRDQCIVEYLRTAGTPSNLRGLNRLLDLFGLYENHISDFGHIALFLKYITTKNQKYKWNSLARIAFDTLKRRLLSQTEELPDFSAQKAAILKLVVYVKDMKLGCCLMQGRNINSYVPVVYDSRELSTAEQNFAALETECLALIWALDRFKCRLFGQKFQLEINQEALPWLKRNKFLNDRLSSWDSVICAWGFELADSQDTAATAVQSGNMTALKGPTNPPGGVASTQQMTPKNVSAKKPIIMPMGEALLPTPAVTVKPVETAVKQVPEATAAPPPRKSPYEVKTQNVNPPVPVQSFRTPASTMFMSDMYGYPKGIPKSFLVNQNVTPPVKPVERATPDPTISSIPDYQIQSALNLPSWILPSQPIVEKPPPKPAMDPEPEPRAKTPIYGQQEPSVDRPYSPSDVYADGSGKADDELREGSESPDALQPGTKRLSAFKRLGPLTEPKKPKLTINLMINKEQVSREVVDETDPDAYRNAPVHLRKDMIQSEDEIVKKYLPVWPWRKNITCRKTASVRFSKSVMILEQEQMEAGYKRDNNFIMVSVKGYPSNWRKEDVLDAILEFVKGKSFIPLFIEFTAQECKFLVIRSRSSLVAIHKAGFCVRRGDVELMITIGLTDCTLNHIDFIPRLVLIKRLTSVYDGEKTLDLKEFCIGKEVSHFIYFPLHRVSNQMGLVRLQSAVDWEHITELNLSHNRLITLDGFELQTTTPRLRHLDLSHNLLERVTILLPCRDLPLRSIKLEGNPLCLDYIDSAHYVKVLKMMFSELMEIDGVPLTLKGQLPPMKPNYCPEAAQGVVEKFLDTLFPLLEAPADYRAAAENLYDKDAVMTVTFRYKLRYGAAFRYCRNLFLRSRNLSEGDSESVRGAPSIGSLLSKWPAIEHDRYSTTVDVLHHDDATTIIRVSGILKLIAESLAEDEHLLTYTRTVVLHTRTGAEYKIHHEMLYWDVPCEEILNTAFNITTVRSKLPTLKLEVPPDDELKSKLLDIFIQLTDVDKQHGERCLEMKNWDLRNALDYFIKILKLGDLSSLNAPQSTTPPLS